MSFPIPRAAFAQHTIALGKTRAGKSSKLRLIVENLLDHKEPVCVIDPKGDWWGLKSSADGKQAGYPVIIFGGEHADVPINEHSGAAVAELIATGNRPCIIDLGGWMVGARTRFFIDFASTLFKLTKGARHLVIDECHNFAPQGRVLDPDAGKMLHWANRLASEGAGKGVILISASQRPQKVHKDYVTSHETLIACRVIHPLDRNAIKDWIDGCADPQVGKDVMTALAGLQRSQAYVWSPEIGFGPKLVDWPLFSTYDSFKPQDARSPAALKGWASVNLDDVKTKLAAVVEEAKANDPKALRARIAELERAARASKPVEKINTPSPDATLKDRERAFQAGERQGYETGYARGWQDGDRAGFSSGVTAAHGVIKAALPDVASVAYVPGAPPKRIPALAHAAGASVGSLPPVPQQSVVTRVQAPVQRAAGARPAGADSLQGPLQRIVDAIRWWNVFGIEEPTHNQVGFIADYKPRGGSWDTYLSRLRSGDLIEKRGPLKLTALGASHANDPEDAPTGEVLRSKVLSMIGGPLQKILRPLIEAYPDSMSKEDAGAASGYEPRGGSWDTYLSRLRSLDLIERRGELRAQNWLFP